MENITDLDIMPTVLGWLNILRAMPLLRWVTIIHAASSAAADIDFPMIHLNNLDMLPIGGEFHETVTLIEHLIAPARCGLRLHGHHDQRTLWGIIGEVNRFLVEGRSEPSHQDDQYGQGYHCWKRSTVHGMRMGDESGSCAPTTGIDNEILSWPLHYFHQALKT